MFRPPTEWGALQNTADVTVAAATKVLLGSFFTTRPLTVRRTRGSVAWKTDQLAVTEQPVGAFGMCIVSDNAFAAGAASIPGPFTESDSDLWFVHQYLYSSMFVASSIGIATRPETQYAIDSSAMRKWTEEERIVLMVENGHATNGALFWLGIRLLVSQARG